MSYQRWENNVGIVDVYLFFSSPFSPFGRELGPAPEEDVGVAADILEADVLSRQQMES